MASKAEHTIKTAADYLGEDKPTSLRLAAARGILGLNRFSATSSFWWATGIFGEAVSVLRSIAKNPAVVDGQRSDALLAVVPHIKGREALTTLLSTPFGSSPQARYFPRLAKAVMDVSTAHQISLPYETIEPYVADDELAPSAAAALEFVVDSRSIDSAQTVGPSRRGRCDGRGNEPRTSG